MSATASITTCNDADKGMLGYAEANVATLAWVINDAEQLVLFDNDTAIPVDLDSTTEWITIWVTAQYFSDSDEVMASV